MEHFRHLLENDPNDPPVTTEDLMRKQEGARANMKMIIEPRLVKEHLERTSHFTRGTLKDVREAGEEVLGLVLMIPSQNNKVTVRIRVSAGNKYAFIPFHKNAVTLSNIITGTTPNVENPSTSSKSSYSLTLNWK